MLAPLRLSNPIVRFMIEGRKFDDAVSLERCLPIFVFLWLFEMFANETANWLDSWLAADANESEVLEDDFEFVLEPGDELLLADDADVGEMIEAICGLN